MCFFTLEDETGLMNLVVTPDTYATYDALLDRQPFLCVSGILESRGEAFSLKVRQVHAPQRPEARVTPLPVRAWM
jgi:DNA polymerase III alpha subunit